MPSPYVAERLAQLAILSDPQQQRTLARDLDRFQNRLNESLTLDLDTGDAAFKESDVRLLVKDLKRSAGSTLGANFETELSEAMRSGFVVLDKQNIDVIPRLSLTNSIVVQRMSDERLQKVARRAGEAKGRGSGPALSPEARALIESTLKDRGLTQLGSGSNQRASDAVLQQYAADRALALGSMEGRESSTGGISFDEWAGGVTSRLDLPSHHLSTGRDDVDPKEDEGPTGGGGGGGGFPTIPLIKDAYIWVTQCFPEISGVTLTATQGPGLCFNQQCGKSLCSLLRGGAAGPLGAAGVAALASLQAGAAVTAVISAGVAGAGGWVAFIVAVCVIVFSFWLDAVITSNGACIHFPWWAGFGPIPFGR
jgi:hypothetical protein